MRPATTSDYRPFPNRARRNWIQRYVELPVMSAALGLPREALRLPRGARLLEVGCGRGVALSYFAERLRPARLVGLDVDPTLLAEAEASWNGSGPVELVCGDARALPFPDSSFDLVVDFGTLFHVARPEQAVVEIARVLAPGGLFVHETWAAQLISHPLRLLRRRTLAPWDATAELRLRRRAGLWTARERAC